MDTSNANIPPLPPLTPPNTLTASNNIRTNRIKLIIFGFLILSFVSAFTFGGYYLGQQKSSPTPTPALLVKPTSIPTPTSDPTEDWKTFKDDVNNLTIQYPADWTILPTGGKKAAEQTLQDYVAIIENANAKSGLSVPIILPLDNETKRKILTQQEIIIKEFENKFLRRKVITAYVSKDTINVITVQGFPTKKLLNESFSNSEKNTFNTIISTIKFLDQNQTIDTSNWKTYENNKYGYTIHYPTNWTITEAKPSTNIVSTFIDLQTHELQKVTFQGISSNNISGQPTIQVSVSTNSSNETYQKIIDDNNANQNYPTSFVTYTTFAGQKAVILSPRAGSYPPYLQIIIINQNYKYTISYLGFDPKTKIEDGEALILENQILSTFKFTQ